MFSVRAKVISVHFEFIGGKIKILPHFSAKYYHHSIKTHVETVVLIEKK